jgi:two-component system, OmpR family, response regulator
VRVAHLAWPREAHRRRELAEAGIPRLLIVEGGATPPRTWDLDEDWVTDPGEVGHRERTLRRRVSLLADPTGLPPVVTVDDDDLVHRTDRWVALSAIEAALVRLLLDREGRAVGRPELAAAAWPDQQRDDRAVDGAIRRARPKLAPLSVAIHGLAGVGYLLDVVSGPAG